MAHEYAQIGRTRQKYAGCSRNRYHIRSCSIHPFVSPCKPLPHFPLFLYQQIREFLTPFPYVVTRVLQRSNTD